MTYYPDLSRYDYSDWPGMPEMKNVGWLDSAHPFPRGSTPKEFKAKLFDLCFQYAMATSGYHNCDFCPRRKDAGALKVRRKWRSIWLGTAEIHVIYRGTTYAAPNMIYHYVVDHDYRPPEEFVEAVINTDTRNVTLCLDGIPFSLIGNMDTAKAKRKWWQFWR